MKKILKNIVGRPINVLCKSRMPNEIFEVELPKTNKWTSETYLLSPVQEVANLIEHKYLEEITDEKKDSETGKEDNPTTREQSVLREYGLDTNMWSKKV